MFQNKADGFKTLTIFGIATTLLLTLILAWGCGNSDDVLLRPTEVTNDEINDDITETSLFAGPKKDKKKEQDQDEQQEQQKDERYVEESNAAAG